MNECENPSTSKCPISRCINFPGSFHCCPDGFKKDPNETICEGKLSLKKKIKRKKKETKIENNKKKKGRQDFLPRLFFFPVYLFLFSDVDECSGNSVVCGRQDLCINTMYDNDSQKGEVFVFFHLSTHFFSFFFSISFLVSVSCYSFPLSFLSFLFLFSKFPHPLQTKRKLKRKKKKENEKEHEKRREKKRSKKEKAEKREKREKRKEGKWPHLWLVILHFYLFFDVVLGYFCCDALKGETRLIDDNGNYYCGSCRGDFETPLIPEVGEMKNKRWKMKMKREKSEKRERKK